MNDTKLIKVMLGYTGTVEGVEAYLPSNFKVISHTPKSGDDMGGTCLVAGRDDHGWTAEGYVIPRLASGLYAAQLVDV